MKKFMHNSSILVKVAGRFDVDIRQLIPIVLSYIKTGNTELYNIKMYHAFEASAPFIKQEIATFTQESIDYYHLLPNVMGIELTPHRLTILYKDNHDEVD